MCCQDNTISGLAADEGETQGTVKMIDRTKVSRVRSPAIGHWWTTLFAVVVLLVVLAVGCTNLKRLAYEGFGRDSWQLPEQVINVLGIQPGQHIADLGSGSGYFTFRLADAVGLTGKVYAVDVDLGMNEYVDKQAREAGYQNVEVVLAEHHDPLIPGDGVDLIFTCNAYHHMEDRAAYFTLVKQYLRDGGQIAIIDFNDKGWFQKLFGHTTPSEVIHSEMGAAGYRLQSEHGFLPKQHFLVFARVADGSE